MGNRVGNEGGIRRGRRPGIGGRRQLQSPCAQAPIRGPAHAAASPETYHTARQGILSPRLGCVKNGEIVQYGTFLLYAMKRALMLGFEALSATRDVHFRQKMQSVIAQKPILTLQVECLPS